MSEIQGKPQVGLIGVGVMGRSMAANIMKNDYPLHVYTRTKEKAESLLASGATWHESPAHLAAATDIVITMVGYPKDVEDLYLGGEGLVQSATREMIFIDMTTSSPELASRLYEAGLQRGVDILDAPVSGGDVGARQGTLSIMVGGREDVYEKVLPLLECMGQNIVYQGPAGSGQHCKMANQIAIASNMLGVCEALAYAEKSGLQPARVLQSIESGAAGSWSLSHLAPRMIGGDFAPGFFVKHFIKDMAIALQSAENINLHTPGLKLAKQLYDMLSEKGGSELGTQALYTLYREEK